MSRNPNNTVLATALGAVIAIAAIWGSAELFQRGQVEREEDRIAQLDLLGNPHTARDYFGGLSPVDISAKYDLVCIHGMPFLRSKLTGEEMFPIPAYSWKINTYAWRACKELYEK